MGYSFDDLREIKLGEFALWLKKNGGLGLMEMHEDSEEEASADRSLDQNRGYCSEKSKIMFAVFAQAGLDPFFVYIRGKDAKKSLLDLGVTISAKDQARADEALHVYVGVKNDSSALYFEPSGMMIDRPYQNSYPVGLNQYWAMDKFNQTMDEFRIRGNPRRLNQLGRQIADLDPNSPFGPIGKGLAFAVIDDMPRALGEFVQAKRLDPNLSVAESFIASALSLRGEYGDRARSIQAFQNYLKKYPESQTAKDNLDTLYWQEGLMNVFK